MISRYRSWVSLVSITNYIQIIYPGWYYLRYLIYIYIYIYIWNTYIHIKKIHIYVYIYIYLCIYIYIYAHIYVCIIILELSLVPKIVLDVSSQVNRAVCLYIYTYILSRFSFKYIIFDIPIHQGRHRTCFQNS